MASESDAPAGPKIEIVAKPESKLPVILPSVMILFVAVVLFLISGIRDALGMLFAAIACVCFPLFVVRYLELGRALIDREGMTLLPPGIGRLRGRPVHFRWDEVVEVRRAPSWTRWAMQIRLNRPREFWKFHPQPQNLIGTPKSICADPRFSEALRAYLPAERIRVDLPFVQRPSLLTRYWWVFAPIILLCAAVTAGCSFAILRGESFIASVTVAIVSLVIGAVAMALCAHGAPAAFGVITGLLIAFVFIAPFSIVLAFFFPSGLALIAGCLGAAAASLVGAALMVIRARKSRGWRYAAVTFLLAAVGFWCAWSGFHRVVGIRVGEGWLDYRSPWTPKGDAFWMTEGGFFAKPDQPTTVVWYSSDLKPERQAVLPASAHCIAIGQEAALFSDRGEPDAQLWLVPRHAEAQVIDRAPSFGYGVVSPDSRRALIPIRGEQRGPLAWKVCDLASGKVEPVNSPLPLNETYAIAFRDDGTVLWLSGSPPLDKGNNRVYQYTPVPESGEFPHPGKPYVVWSWKINSTESPAQLYAARTQWLEWNRWDKPERLRVCRVSEKPPARAEYVELDFTQSPPREATITEEEFDARGPPARSFDGRFTLETGRAGVFTPEFIVDTKTGRKFSMPSTGELMGLTFPLWSPSANKFLMEVPETKLAPGFWCWHREFGQSFERTMVVYLVDMDRQ